MHEQSETVQDEFGRWINIYGRKTPKAGQQLPGTSSYSTMEEAVAEARKRSENTMEIGQTYAQMLGMAESSQPNMTPLRQGMESVTDPNAAAPLAAIHRPVQTPDELEARKSGWQQVAEKLTDPNVLRAFGFAGAAMAQPGGTIGHGIASGLTAFQAGEYAKRQQGLEDRTMTMEEAKNRSAVESVDAGTAIRRAQLPGVKAESDVSAATVKDRVDLVRSEVQRARMQLENARNANEISNIERDLLKRKAQIQSTIPDAKLRAAAIAELDKAIMEAQLKQSQARENAAQARRYEAELRGLKTVSDEDLPQYFTRTGKFAPAAGGGSSSRFTQEANFWEKIYDGLKANAPDDAQIKGLTKEQFVRDRLVRAEDRDTMNTLVRAIQFMEPGSPEEAAAKQMLADILGRKDRPDPNAPPKPTGGKETPWQTMGPTSPFEFRVLADGTRQVRRKQSPTTPSNISDNPAP